MTHSGRIDEGRQAFHRNALQVSASLVDTNQLDLLIDDFIDQLRNGHRPDIEQYAARLPQAAEQIRDLLPAIMAIEQAAPVVNIGPRGEQGSRHDCPAVLGDYRILRQIGRGGMGVVYEAVQKSLDRHVALKTLPPCVANNANHLARFRREVQAAGKLHHTNIVPVFGVGESDGIHFYAMQYISGCDMERLLEIVRPMRTGRSVHSTELRPVACGDTVVDRQQQTLVDFFTDGEQLYEQRIARLACQAAEALSHAHTQGVLHRDVKPSNLLLDVHGQLWVTDFGLAKADENDDLTATGDLVGTLRYMAPERFLGKSDARSDVYSLGVTLYELITLRPAFESTNRAELMRAVLESTPPAPRSIVPHLSRDLETIIQKAMSKEPERRFATAKAMADDLRRYLAGDTIVARPISGLERFYRKCVRSPGMTAAIACLIVMSVFSFVAIVRQWRIAVSALASESEARAQAEIQSVHAAEAEATTQRALYFHRVNLAHKEWQSGNVGRAEELLSQCPTNIRDWEWRYVQRLCNHDLLQLRHDGAVTKVAISPNGKLIATCGAADRLHTKTQVCLWDANSGEKVWSYATNSGKATSLAFTPDNRYLAVASLRDDSQPGTGFPQLIVWDVVSKEIVYRLGAKQSGTSVLAFSPDGQFLVTGSSNRISAFVSQTQTQIFNSNNSSAHSSLKESATFGLAFHPAENLFASVGLDGKARIWSIDQKKQIAQLDCGLDARAVSWCPDGERIAVATWNGIISVWNTSTYKKDLEFDRHASPVLAVEFSPDGRNIASADYSGIIKIWNAKTGREQATLRGHTGSVTSLAFSPHGRTIVTGGEDGLVRMWDATAASQEHTANWPSTKRNSQIRFTDDGTMLAAGYRSSWNSQFDSHIHIWNRATGEHSSLKAHQSGCCALAVSHQGAIFATGGDDNRVRLWDMKTRAMLNEFSSTHQGRVYAVDLSRDGVWLASSGDDEHINLWNLSSKQPVAVRLSQPAPAKQVLFSHDNQLLFTACDNGWIFAWSVQDGRRVAEFQAHDHTINSLALSPNGLWLASGGEDNQVYLWPIDALGSSRPIRSYTGHTQAVTALCFSPDSQRLLSGSWDKTAKLWDVMSSNETITLRAGSDRVYAVAFSQDGRYVATASDKIRLWDAQAGQSETDQQVAATAGSLARQWHLSQATLSLKENPPNHFAWVFHKLRAQ